MDRDRFEHLLAAYGGELRRWPAEERAEAAAFAAEHADAAAALKAAVAFDRVLDSAREDASDVSGLASRILAQAPRAGPWLNGRALLALAACAVFGVVLGYGGGMLAPVVMDDGYFAAAFEAPSQFGDEG
jgi:hypothetical protein